MLDAQARFAHADLAAIGKLHRDLAVLNADLSFRAMAGKRRILQLPTVGGFGHYAAILLGDRLAEGTENALRRPRGRDAVVAYAKQAFRGLLPTGPEEGAQV